jgi:hypothetical protein
MQTELEKSIVSLKVRAREPCHHQPTTTTLSPLTARFLLTAGSNSDGDGHSG